jgi:hypothetical protein
MYLKIHKTSKNCNLKPALNMGKGKLGVADLFWDFRRFKHSYLPGL